MTAHVVQFSGGIGSFATAVRVAEKYGTDHLTLLIADTQVEDPDIWRFAEDTSRLLGVPLTKVADGRTPWQVFRDKRFLGNDRLAPCSRTLKQIPCRAWMEKHRDPKYTLVYIGIESTVRDRARIPAIARAWKPWHSRFPLCSRWERPRTKAELLQEARALGVAPPRLYELGFSHNNCGGTCVRARVRQWKHLLDVMPDRYAYAEQQEEDLRRLLGPVTILRRRRKGVATPLSLADLRHEHQAAPMLPAPMTAARTMTAVTLEASR
ncbi:hypothetical protein SRB5_16010 [Streptomyces sp. RB5]|uniref:Phosphoadenosine phosphosulphate reductase domain-containing protein n=1 Tax=Streptomyces smaragdinus TaxID=2585196 RepID=A0A7K0CEK9_9ACTN|nr:hypothetical protein [Streptomyces smaragdinus]MQY11482.1 hypothetical protein [Streptomyces smaragdinus]